MEWHFATNDGRIALSLRQGAAGSSGHLIYAGEELLAIGGQLDAGLQQVSLESPSRFTGTLAVSGNPANPISLQLSGTFDGTQVHAELVQQANRSIEDIVDAYRRAYAVFTIEGTDDTPRCTEAWQGMGTLKARDGMVGLLAPVGFDYKNPFNTTLPAEKIANICRPDGPDGQFTLHIPKMETLGRTPGPVIIQFVGEADHFAAPPFEHPHSEIANVFHEEYKRTCLSVEYANSGSPLTLHFSHGKKRNHKSIIIQPNAV
jgi:hypothetical protein